MADFDDLKLDKSAAPPPPPQPRWVPIVALAALLVAAVALWFYLRDTPDGAGDTSPQTTAAGRVEDAQPASDPTLPPLDQSDDFVRELIRALSQHPIVASLLTTDQLIRTFAVSIHALADGNTPAAHLHKIPPGSPFAVQTQGGRTVIDPRSYSRFDRHAAAIDGLDAAGAARIYERLKPRIEEAYREVAGPTADLDRAFERAVANVLRTPVIQEPIAVRKSVAGYTYADPALESLPRAQQQMLRMGPRNVETLQRKVREIAKELAVR